MTTQFLKKLAELDEMSTSKEFSTSNRAGGAPIYGLLPWHEGVATLVKHHSDAQLICLLRNNSKAIRELVEAADHLINSIDWDITGKEHLDEYAAKKTTEALADLEALDK